MKLCECGCGKPAPIASKTNTKKGAVKGEPLRFIHGHQSRKKCQPPVCIYCGSEIKRTIMKGGREEDLFKYKERKFCSSECSAMFHSGANSHNWKGGKRVDANGYIYVLVGRNHHLSDPSGYALEHRVVAEEKISRALLPGEVVHHINGNRHDNRPENLQVMNGNDHLELHRKMRDGQTWEQMPEVSHG